MAAISHPVDRETAIHEITRVQVLIQLLQTLPAVASSSSAAASPSSAAASWPELAEVLFEQLRQSLDMALSILKVRGSSSSSGGAVYGSSPPLPPPPQGGGDVSLKRKSIGEIQGGGRNVPIKKRKCMNSLTRITDQPDYDGYLWRKYGDKMIQGVKSHRSYYRCSYKNEKGCQATKQVERAANDKPSMFVVTYKNKHTCQGGDHHYPLVNLTSDYLQEISCLLPFSEQRNEVIKHESDLQSNSNTSDLSPVQEEQCQQLPPEQQKVAFGVVEEEDPVLPFSNDSFDTPPGDTYANMFLDPMSPSDLHLDLIMELLGRNDAYY